jgi:F0F1-type ATP synthase epsilon subunit
MSLTVNLHSLQNITSFAGVSSIKVNATEGQITILPKHGKLITKIYCNIINIQAEQSYAFFLGLALLQVENNIVHISTDLAVDLNNIKSIEAYKAHIKSDYLNKLEIILNHAKK